MCDDCAFLTWHMLITGFPVMQPSARMFLPSAMAEMSAGAGFLATCSLHAAAKCARWRPSCSKLLATLALRGIRRKKKLLKKQAEGKKRMKSMGRVNVPQEAFMAMVSTCASACGWLDDDNETSCCRACQ